MCNLTPSIQMRSSPKMLCAFIAECGRKRVLWQKCWQNFGEAGNIFKIVAWNLWVQGTKLVLYPAASIYWWHTSCAKHGLQPINFLSVQCAQSSCISNESGPAAVFPPDLVQAVLHSISDPSWSGQVSIELTLWSNISHLWLLEGLHHVSWT